MSVCGLGGNKGSLYIHAASTEVSTSWLSAQPRTRDVLPTLISIFSRQLR